MDVFKTFNPDIYGDFAGGTVNINTSQGSQSQTKINFGTGLTTNNNLSNFNDFEQLIEFLVYDKNSNKFRINKKYLKSNFDFLISTFITLNLCEKDTNNYFLLSIPEHKIFEIPLDGLSQKQLDKKIVLTTVAFGNDRDAMKNLKEISEKGEGSFIHIKKRHGSEDKLLEEIKMRSRR